MNVEEYLMLAIQYNEDEDSERYFNDEECKTYVKQSKYISRFLDSNAVLNMNIQFVSVLIKISF